MLVDHRNLILPQLAATGIEAKIIKEKTGWNVIWRPVYAKDIPTFIKNNFRKTSEMRETRFPLLRRIEIAVAWAFPYSIIIGLIMAFLWPEAILSSITLTWILTLLIFTSFPLYSGWLNRQKKEIGFSRYTVFFDLSPILLILWGIFILSFIFYGIITDYFSLILIFRWSIISFAILLLVSFDILGSTPTYKCSLHEDRLLKIFLDKKRCRGCGICIEVCPRNCFEMNLKQHIVKIYNAYKCVKCGACIVQCPFNALYFKSQEGQKNTSRDD